ncbi:MAG TPA: penicillin amidase, partial [Gammaproteobacteria bacterium]|nr:penicillin amidase [Gammaproteobacteria bacterium]
MKHWLISFLSTLIAFCLSSTAALACTDFRLIAKDGTVLITRSLEFALDLKSNLMSSPRNRSIDNATLEGKPALSWKTKYGYLFFDGLDTGMAIDGMN